jgi:hypothetical protein
MVLALVLVFALPAAAQEPEGDVEEGLDLFSEGTRLLLRGLMDEVGPALRELRETLGGIDDYHAPEVLPNGDIIIRRRTPLVPEETPPVDEGDAIDL